MDIEEAKQKIQDLESELRHSPWEADLYAQLAETYFQSGAFSDKAQKVYSRALDRQPDHEIAQLAMSICLLVRSIEDLLKTESFAPSPSEEALAELHDSLQEHLEAQPFSADLNKAAGDVLLLRQKHDAALKLYHKAMQQAPESLEAFVQSAKYVANMERIPLEMALFFGRLLQKIGRARMAARILLAAYRQKSHNRLASALIPLLERDLIPAANPDEAHRFRMQLCYLYLNRKNVYDSLRIYREIEPQRTIDPKFIRALTRRLIEVEDYRAAFDCISRIPIDEEAKNLLNEIAVALENRGELDTAAYLLQFINRNDLVILEAERLKAIDMERIAQMQLAELNLKSHRYERAVGNLLKALEMGSTDETDILRQIDNALAQVAKPDPDHLKRLAEYCLQLEDTKRASQYLQRALNAQPNDSQVIEKLRNCYDTLLERDPDSPEILLKSADLHLQMGEIDTAIREIRAATAYPEREAEASIRLAQAYLLNNQLIESLDLFKKISIAESHFELLYDLQNRLAEKKQFALAQEAALLIAGTDPGYRDITSRLREYEKRLSEATEAEKETMSQFRDPKMLELIGDVAVGRYRYIEKIGSGGMGVVHKVWDLRNQTEVAMKILRNSLSSSRKAIDRFFREARIVATLNHPNIVNIFDYNINANPSQSYIAMEFVDGPSLRDILEERLEHSAELTREYIAQMLCHMAQLCDALEATHSRGIVHRDIKPDNVMIASNQAVKITDFGIVHIEEVTFTPTGALIGTPRYMSPEQVKGGRVDGRSDIYAVGIILYEMLVGSPPFTSGDLAYQQVNVQPTPLREISAAIPKEVEQIVLQCLAKDPEERYSTAPELKHHINQVLQDLYPDISDRLMAAGHTTDMDIDLDLE